MGTTALHHPSEKRIAIGDSHEDCNMFQDFVASSLFGYAEAVKQRRLAVCWTARMVRLRVLLMVRRFRVTVLLCVLCGLYYL